MRWQDIIGEDRAPFHYKGTITFYDGDARARIADEGDHFYLDKVYTDPDSRGNGHATKAIQKALAYVDQFGKPTKLVAVPDEDEDMPRLITFYQKFGFEQDMTNRQGYLMIRPSMGN